MGLVYINGDFVPSHEAKVSVFDHGFLYGDGVFEGIRAYHGRVFKLNEHMERLYASAKAVMLCIPQDEATLAQAIVESCRVNRLQDGYIRVVVSRGTGDLGLDPQRCTRPNVIIIADKIALFPPELYQVGMRVVTVATRRNIAEAVNPRIKSLNYLNNIMAKIEASLAGCHEVLMLNQDGFVTEGTGDNLFVVSTKGELLTPPTHAGCMEGITRNTVMELAQERGVRTRESLLTRYEVHVAREVFLTGTAAEIMPVVEVDGRTIGDGKPGRLTRLLMEEYGCLVRVSGTPIFEGESPQTLMATGGATT